MYICGIWRRNKRVLLVRLTTSENHLVVFNESEGRASTEHETREREEYVELNMSENDP